MFDVPNFLFFISVHLRSSAAKDFWVAARPALKLFVTFVVKLLKCLANVSLKKRNGNQNCTIFALFRHFTKDVNLVQDNPKSKIAYFPANL